MPTPILNAVDQKKRRTIESSLFVIGRIDQATLEIQAKLPNVINWSGLAPLCSTLEEVLVDATCMRCVPMETVDRVHSLVLMMDMMTSSFNKLEMTKQHLHARECRQQAAVFDMQVVGLIEGIRSRRDGEDVEETSDVTMVNAAVPAGVSATDAEDLVKSLRTAIKTKSMQKMARAAQDTMNAAMASEESAESIVVAGAVLPLLSIAKGNAVDCVVPAMETLSLLAHTSRLCCQQIVDLKGLVTMVHVCKLGHPIADLDAEIVVDSLMTALEECKQQVVKAGLIPHIFRIILSKADPNSVNYGLRIVSKIVGTQGAAEIVAQCGGISVLAAMFKQINHDGLRLRLAFILHVLAEVSEAYRDQVYDAGATETLLAMTRSKNDDVVYLGLTVLRDLGSKKETLDFIAAENGIKHLVEVLDRGLEDSKDIATAIMDQMVGFTDLCIKLDEANVFAPLMKLVRARHDNIAEYSKDTGVINALEVIAIAMQRLERDDLVGSTDDLTLLVDVVKRGPSCMKDSASAILAQLAERDDLRAKIIDLGIVKLILDQTKLLQGRSDYSETLESLACMAASIDVAKQIVHHGGIDVCVELLKNGDEIMRDIAAQILGQLAQQEGFQGLIGHAGGVELLLKQAFSMAAEDYEGNALRALASLAALEGNRTRIVEAGGSKIVHQILSLEPPQEVVEPARLLLSIL